VVYAYRFRPPYPLETIQFLAGLAVDFPRRVLDVGCGTGDIARLLASFVEKIDAVDISAGMIDYGTRLQGGDNPSITWIHGSVEETQLSDKYALITAGESFHWMAWDLVLARFAEVLSAHGVVAIIDRNWEGPAPLSDCLSSLIPRRAPQGSYRLRVLASIRAGGFSLRQEELTCDLVGAPMRRSHLLSRASNPP
jgi:ubiquinone/menaquinone biosynthesis C-methylase UbiE